ncbi:MAG TPA: NAD-dependent epimerase/dehydratase family protein [Epsilonproteobacteria bacterium]|nr:NAD-dependent epimerase/dehydratase family protein [Campylobacterota bacterium]
MKKVLITGIDSFTGVYLAEVMKNSGYQVYGTSLFDEGVFKYKCDITDSNDVLRVLEDSWPDYLIHLSGISFAAHGNSEDFYKVNTIGTTNILDAFVNLGIQPKKIILASSATVYGNQGLEVLDESLCPMPANHYGASKYAMECLSKGYFDKLPIVIVRPFNYTGVGQSAHFLIPKIVEHFRNSKSTIELGNLHVSREFNDVNYVCNVYKKLLEAPCASEIVNLCSGRGVKLLDVITMMNEIAGYDINVEVNQSFVRQNEIPSLTGSTQKLFKLIGSQDQLGLKTMLRGMFEA